MNYGKLTAGTTKTAIDTAKPSEKGEIITYLSRMGDVLEQIFERNEIGQAFLGVLVLGYGDISHLFLRELVFQIVADHDVVTPEAAEVFGDNAVHSSCIHICHHSLEIRSFKRSATPSVVDVLANHMKLLFLCVLL